MKKFLTHQLRLIESRDKEGKDWEVVLIQAGQSLNGKIYPPDVLKKALPLFENAKAFAFEFSKDLLNHLPDWIQKAIPEGFPRSMVGWYDNLRYGEFTDGNGKSQEGVLARFHIADNARWLRQLLRDAWEHGKKTLLGFSIDGDGILSEVIRAGKKLLQVDEIKHINSVDVVTHPAAGGQLRRLVASFTEEELSTMKWLKELFERVKSFKASAVDGIDSENITPDQEITLLEALIGSDDFFEKSKVQEQGGPFVQATLNRVLELIEGDKADQAAKMLKDLLGKMKKYGYPKQKEAAPAQTAASAAPAAASADALQAKMNELDQKIAKADEILKAASVSASASLLDKKLGESGLPIPVQAKLRIFFQGKNVSESDITESINVEKDTLAKLTESGAVVLPGQGRIEMGQDQMDKFQIAMDKMVDPDLKLEGDAAKVGAFRGIKEAYNAINPEDRDVSGQLIPGRQRLSIKEAITTGDFTYILGTSLTRKAQKFYKMVPFRFDPIVTKVPVSDFKQQERVKWGSWSILPTITEDAAYTDLYEPKDEEATYTAGTKGGYVSISRKTIKNDDLGYIRTIPKLLGNGARWTLETDVTNLLILNSTYTPDGAALFTAAKGNYTTSGITYALLTARKAAMFDKQIRGTQQDSGTATAGASTTITDSTKSWTTNAFANYYVRIVYGTGAGQRRVIASNTATAITVSAAWTTNPDTTSKYEVSAAQADDQVIGLESKHILFGSNIKGTVEQLLKSEYDPDTASKLISNIHRGTLNPIQVPLMKIGSTYQNYWFLAADKSQCDMIEVGFVDGMEEPFLVIQDQPYAGQVFTNDRIRYKVRYEYGLTAVDYVGLDGNFA